MENRPRKNSSSGDLFSFPVIIPPAQDSDQFEFGCVTTAGSPNSPADHLFLNGKLLPHAFPIQTPNSTFSYSRSTSRTSSINSKDSLMSSRSNSTNSSRSSNCSSARTSTSEASERKIMSSTDGNIRMSVRKERNNKSLLSCQYQYYGSSQRWQLIAAAPVLKHQGSRSRKVEILERKGSKKSREIDEGAKSWFGRRILKSFVSACKECHAIQT